mmetsp:Transcript_30651/g.78269  ORF Transcript_30651/g.78269 Transcript_30651/m.78269 type:complete len:362 (-) Transcript_30651:591-1676(-)|eukprot:CAMPEP_0202865192 /NCGR_PEP_ID=MMETSP1391-20130828/5322_1 /ASSEMBLY_ACC=CAM_ASM_000867 /TAXON_ID=1034604 /ORGANISM="Chlamydomonas leiostraca, Strain SAG 11-49" /LENGTH=361 /DNA_ID=CAMNT_0049544997 /DNA_START=226 /DNA_END=1311 /DNA_ORIENTATION=+
MQRAAGNQQPQCTCCKRLVDEVAPPTGAKSGAKKEQHLLCGQCQSREVITGCSFSQCGACGMQMLRQQLIKHTPQCHGSGTAPHADLHGTEGVRCTHRQHLVPSDAIVHGKTACRYCHTKRKPGAAADSGEERPSKRTRIAAGSSTSSSSTSAAAVPAVPAVPAWLSAASPPGSAAGSSSSGGAGAVVPSGWSTVTTEMAARSPSPTPSSAAAPAQAARSPFAALPPMGPIPTPPAPAAAPPASKPAPRAPSLPFPSLSLPASRMHSLLAGAGVGGLDDMATIPAFILMSDDDEDLPVVSEESCGSLSSLRDEVHADERAVNNPLLTSIRLDSLEDGELHYDGTLFDGVLDGFRGLDLARS